MVADWMKSIVFNCVDGWLELMEVLKNDRLFECIRPPNTVRKPNIVRYIRIHSAPRFQQHNQ